MCQNKFILHVKGSVNCYAFYLKLSCLDITHSESHNKILIEQVKYQGGDVTWLITL